MTRSVVAVLGRGLVDPDEPVVRADDHGLARGDGCFETCRVVAEGAGRVQNFDAHLRRLSRSVAALEIDVDLDACRELAELAVAAWPAPGEAALRITVTRGWDADGPATVIATVSAVSPTSISQRRTGVRVVTLPRGSTSISYDDAPWLLGGVKSLSYAINMAALRTAARRGADDAIWTSSDGYVLEAPTATVLWSSGRQLGTTPTGATGILAGTTIADLFSGAANAGFEPVVTPLSVSALPAVDGLWLASSVRGVVEVVLLDGRPRTTYPEVTTRLQRLAGF